MPGVAGVHGVRGAGPLVRALPRVVGAGGGSGGGGVAAGEVLLQVVEPHGQGGAVVQGGGGVDQGVGEQLPALLHEEAALDGVTQHLLQQIHVLTFCLAVARLQQGQVGQQQGHHLLLRLLVPLVNDGWTGETGETTQ